VRGPVPQDGLSDGPAETHLGPLMVLLNWVGKPMPPRIAKGMVFNSTPACWRSEGV